MGVPRMAISRALLLMVFVAAIAGWARAQSGRTFYIDFSSGSNSNSGTSTSTPWKSAPFMFHSAGCDSSSGPSYAHQSGDRFIFKGGVTWPAACFEMAITAGGTSSAQDYYGVCLGTDSDSPCSGGTSWPSSGWTRPLFGGSNASLGTGANLIRSYTGNDFQSATIGYITIDNIEMTAWNAPPSTGAVSQGGAAIVMGGLQSQWAAAGTIVENMYIHDWVSANNSTYSTANNSYGTVYGVGTLKNSEIGDPNGFYTVGGTRYNAPTMGGCAGCTEVYGNKIHDGWMGCSSVYSCHDNEFYNIVGVYNPTPSTSAYTLIGIHPHVIYEDGAGQSAVYAYNNVLHDNQPGLLIQMFYYSYIFNNVFWNNGKAAIYLNQCEPGLGTAPCGDSSARVGYILNNTMDMTSVPAGNDAGGCFAWYNGPAQSGNAGPGLGTIYVQNNICRPGAGGVGAFQAATLHSSNNNTTMGATEATTYGFTPANKYRPTSSDPNVAGQGLNFTSICSGELAAVCKDASGAPWLGGSYITRPTGSTAWDLGAYEGQGSPSGGPPTISLTAPSSGATVSASISLTASCTPQGSATVNSIQFMIDGNNFGAAGPASPYTLSWNTLTAANGSHTISAVCTDSNSQTAGASTVTVTVSNSMPGCFVSGSNTNWNTYQAFTAQTTNFTATFTAAPNTNDQDSVIALSQAPMSAYSQGAALVRFNSSGQIDVYKGSLGNYTADATVSYTAGATYSFTFTVNMTAGTYTVALTSPTSVTIATGYSFRTTASATSLGYINAASDNTTPDTAQVCNFQIGSAASLTFSPASLSFGNVTVGGNGAQTVTTTTSGGSVSFTSVTIAGNADFTINSNTCTGSISSSCATQIQFAPTSAALETATITYTDTATGSPQTVAVSGTGVPATPTLSLSPTSLNFGGVQLHATSSTGPIVLTIASGPVTFTGTPSFSGANAADFALASNTCAGSVAAASCRTVVSFTPSIVGSESATLSYTDNATGSPQSAPLSGSGYLAPHPPTAVQATVN
jgi:Bacterial Ig domain